MLKAELIEMLDDISDVLDDEDLTPSEKIAEIDDMLSDKDEDEESEDEEN